MSKFWIKRIVLTALFIILTSGAFVILMNVSLSLMQFCIFYAVLGIVFTCMGTAIVPSLHEALNGEF